MKKPFDQKQIDSVQGKINACVAEINKSEDAKFIDAQVIAITPNNPHAKDLLNSTEKINATQAKVLANFIATTHQCRLIANELPDAALVAVYSDFYTKIDAVYADLLAKKITIGVANQERALLIQDARSRWAGVLRYHRTT